MVRYSSPPNIPVIQTRKDCIQYIRMVSLHEACVIKLPNLAEFLLSYSNEFLFNFFGPRLEFTRNIRVALAQHIGR